jgi:hypothetical protein
MAPDPTTSGAKAALYHDNGNGTFTSVTNSVGVTGAKTGNGCSWADYDGDGYPDLFVADSDLWVADGIVGSRLYHNNGDGSFSQVTSGDIASKPLALGCYWGDYDNDGFLDLFVANLGNSGVGENNFLFHNDRQGGFERIMTGSLVNDQGASTGSAWGDYDDDGFLDLVVVNYDINSRAFLYRNNGNTNHWLELNLIGTASNRAAIGAKVRVKATIWGKSVWQLREISGGTGYGSQNDLRAHFGLGDATNADAIRIEWPSGNVRELTDIQPNQLLKLTEATGITPVAPTASLNGSIQLARSSLAGASYPWRFDGIEIAGQTNRTLSLSNIVASQQGRYSVVVSNATIIATNYAYLHVDTTFTKITEGAIVNDPGNSYIPSWGDYNGDGWLDLFVANGANEGPAVPFLYRNDQHGGFVRVRADEVGELATNSIQAAEGSWADYDNDGNLDLFIDAIGSGKSQLYHNEGNGRFRRVTDDVGINRLYYPAGSAWGDYDKDGFVDLYLGTGWLGFDTDMLWRNVGGTTFARSRTCPFVSMSVNYGAWGDADNDGDLDLYVPNMADGANAFYRNQGSGVFKYDGSAGLVSGGGGAVMPVWADFNNDGYLDLFVARNSTPCYYFQNNRDGTFKEITTGPHTQTYGIIASAGDYDNDGYLDLFVTRGQGGKVRPCCYTTKGTVHSPPSRAGR